MTAERYKLSFTAGALLVREAGVAAPLYLDTRDWSTVRAMLDDENLLQARTIASGRRLGREVVQRLAGLTDEEVALFVDSTAIERGHLMWAAACRVFDLIGEFAEEVLRERFLLMTPTITPDAFDSFVQSKALWHEELTALADSTRKRLRSNLFLMLREAALVSEDGDIILTVLSQRVAAAFAANNRNDVRFFPAHGVIDEERVP